MNAASLYDATLLTDSRSAPRTGSTADQEKAKKAAQEFESFFVSQTLESMFAGIKTDGPFGGGNGEQMFRSLMIQEFGKEISKRGGFGIAEQVYAEILKTQEVK